MMAPAPHFSARALLTLAALGLPALIGCKPSVATKTASITMPLHSTDSLETVREAFKKQAGLQSYRSALQQLNTTFGGTEAKPAPLTSAQRQFLANEVGLDDDELGEVSSLTFTPMDAHYLDQCLLLRDSARSFDVPELAPLARAKNAFAWVLRQVRLQ